MVLTQPMRGDARTGVGQRNPEERSGGRQIRIVYSIGFNRLDAAFDFAVQKRAISGHNTLLKEVIFKWGEYDSGRCCGYGVVSRF